MKLIHESFDRYVREGNVLSMTGHRVRKFAEHLSAVFDDKTRVRYDGHELQATVHVKNKYGPGQDPVRDASLMIGKIAHDTGIVRLFEFQRPIVRAGELDTTVITMSWLPHENTMQESADPERLRKLAALGPDPDVTAATARRDVRSGAFLERIQELFPAYRIKTDAPDEDFDYYVYEAHINAYISVVFMTNDHETWWSHVIVESVWDEEETVMHREGTFEDVVVTQSTYFEYHGDTAEEYEDLQTRSEKAMAAKDYDAAEAYRMRSMRMIDAMGTPR